MVMGLMSKLFQELHAEPFLSGQMERAFEKVAFGSLCDGSIAVKIAKPLTVLLVVEYHVGVFMNSAVHFCIFFILCQIYRIYFLK